MILGNLTAATLLVFFPSGPGRVLRAQGAASQTASPTHGLSRTEYNLIIAVHSEHEPRRKLQLLQEWAAQFPRSAYRQERFNQIVVTQKALGDGRGMWNTARQMAVDDQSGPGNYWLTLLTIQLQVDTPADLARGQNAAYALLRNLPNSFAISNKPSSVADADWYRERDRQKVLAHRTLGWVAMREGRWDTAIQELRQVLTASPNDAEASYWLGTAMLGPKVPANEPGALYCFARSLAVTGPGALTPAAKRLVQPYFQQSYTRFYGSEDGMRQLLAQARNSALPPSMPTVVATSRPIVQGSRRRSSSRP